MTTVRTIFSRDDLGGFPGRLVAQGVDGHVDNAEPARASVWSQLEAAAAHLAGVRRLAIPCMVGPWTTPYGVTTTRPLARIPRPPYARKALIRGYYFSSTDNLTAQIEVRSSTDFTWTPAATDGLAGSPSTGLINALPFAIEKIIGAGTKSDLGYEDLEIRLSIPNGTGGDILTVQSATVAIEFLGDLPL
jgi:hypothetical protein